jgi:hypothetical protein
VKAAALQTFLREWLAARGLAPELLETDVWQIAVPKDLRERFGKTELVFSFSRRAMAKHPRAELAVVGNPVFDRLLGVAREEGRVGIGYAKPGGASAKPPAAEKLPPVGDLVAGKPEPVYQAVYHFVFTITYPSIEAADEMEVVSVDSGSLDVWAQTADLAEIWAGLEPDPRKGRVPIVSVPIPEWAVDAGVRALERRMRRRIKKVEQSCQERLDEETGSIRTYYEQLIEEARNQSRRWSTRVEEREERIHFLQLEWKRRIEEAHAFWTPQVNARLVAVGIQMLPRQSYRFLPTRATKAGTKVGGKAAARHAPIRVWDEATRKLLPAFCVSCGATAIENPRPDGSGGWVCGDCEGKAAWKVKGEVGGDDSPPLTRGRPGR